MIYIQSWLRSADVFNVTSFGGGVKVKNDPDAGKQCEVQSEDSLTPIRVLVIDDSYEDYLLASTMLRRSCGSRYQTEWCGDLSELLKKMVSNEFDIYLLDQSLGRISGTELLEQAITDGCIRPIVMLTGRTEASIDEEALRRGASDYIIKTDLSGALLDRVIRYAISRSKEHAALRRQALHDTLTGLANRTLFSERLSQTVARARRDESFSFLLMFVDLDDFKPINDRFGHDAGDELLIQISARLRESRREVDTIARLGGDEFALLLPEVESVEATRSLAMRLINTLQQPVAIRGHLVRVGASIGCRLARGPSLDSSLLLKEADEAMYAAKKQGSGRFVIADGHELVRHLSVHSRPKCSEELICLRPRLGGAGEIEVILVGSSVAVGTGLNQQQVQKLIEYSLRQMYIWNTTAITPLILYLSIARQHVNDPGFPMLVERALAEVPGVRGRLVLEVDGLTKVNSLGSIVQSEMIVQIVSTSSRIQAA